ncbi:1009_t:CDS:2, partial [Diversispora eburnea]
TSKDPNLQQSEKSIKSRAPPSRLAKEDIDCIMYTKKLKDANLPNWYINNSKFEKMDISPEPTPQIDIPKKPDIVKPDPIKVKRMRKQCEMERIAKNIFRSELSKLVQADD